jgi:glycosyltransferase involved in cell wall biosynthesis
MERLLVLAPGSSGKYLDGPAVRAWEMANALGEHFAVSVAAASPPPRPLGGITEVVDGDRRSILRAARRCDGVLSAWVAPYLISFAAAREMLIISDLYDPAEVEATFVPRDAGYLASLTELTSLQLRFADLIACGSDAQRAALLRRGQAVNRSGDHVVTVPFGVTRREPRVAQHGVLRTKFGFEPSDFVILWWGSLWPWLDPATAIRAVARVACRRPEVRLVLTAGPPPERATRWLADPSDARRLAESLGVLNRSVFFLDSWIPYEARYDYLDDADLGITLHRDAQEGAMAARARHADYVSAGIPCVLTRGDAGAEQLARRGVAELVPTGSVEATAIAVEDWASDKARRTAASAAARREAADATWARRLEPLALALRTARPPARVQRLPAALAASTSYYLRVLRGRARLGHTFMDTKPASQNGP